MFPLWIRWLFGFLFSAISLGGLFGNGLVIAAVLGHPKMRCSAMNILLLNLAIADLLNLALTSLEWAPALWIGRPQWPLEWWWTCPLVRYFEYVFLFASILSQLAVCTERFVAICLPLHARRWCTHRNVLNSLLFIWAFVLLFSLPNALFNERIQIKKSSSHSMALCLNPWSFTEFWLTYKWAEFLFLFLVPAICCALLHCRLHFALKKTSAAGNVYQQDLLHKNKTIQYRQMRSRRRVAHKLLGCMAVQLLCYSPIQAMFLATALFDIVLIPPYGLILLLNVLALACSAANPLLYTLCSQNFRSRTKAMFIGHTAVPKRVIVYADRGQPFNRIRAATI